MTEKIKASHVPPSNITGFDSRAVGFCVPKLLAVTGGTVVNLRIMDSLVDFSQIVRNFHSKVVEMLYCCACWKTQVDSKYFPNSCCRANMG